ncbi:DUF4145 domain-containing protein [Bradyrhizobium cosmicum]|uniref:DUF4145 domain-containing protein n=1 Tax=Bradyrhizobium cosmicum TaxID=1404864 RepID=UPI0028ED7BFB|nr:DUF4145 domain-containing protein [Bradyrhizobium cosmicum]
MSSSKLARRFEELRLQLEVIEKAKKPLQGSFPGYSVDENALLGWEIKAINLLEMACSANSIHVKSFKKVQEPEAYRSSQEKLLQLGAVFDAAREDFNGGYLNSVRHLIQSEVFDSELEQAKELLSAKYKVAAAVITGVVLETTLRQMCSDKGLLPGKLDKMNADLAKSGAYNLQVQKRITALADIRNNAAHGHAEKFREDDVIEMIVYVERFLADHLAP